MTTVRGDNLVAECPAEFFVALWRIAECWTPAERAASELDRATSVALRIKSSVDCQDGRAAAAGLRGLLSSFSGSIKSYRGLVLALMGELDQQFLAIHPRSVATATPPPMWLTNCQSRWVSRGAYFRDDEVALIPRGPFGRSARGEFEASAETLEDRFAALAVVPTRLSQNGREIPICIKHVCNDIAFGVSAGSQIGSESIVFVPIVESRGEMQMIPRHMQTQSFVDYCRSSSLDPAERLASAISTAGDCDIVVSPEFVMMEEDQESLSRRLVANLTMARLIVSGSGQTTSKGENFPWNECRAVNRFGRQIWEQRKLWPASIPCETAKSYGLADTGPSKHLLEATESGGEVVIADVETIGRCVILICQDLMIYPMAAELLRMFQPDWVFVPILDRAEYVGRWAHQRAFELSSLSPARFLISNSLAFGSSCTDIDGLGMSVGPKSGDIGPPQGRKFLVHPATNATPLFAKFRWHEAEWGTTELTEQRP